MTFERELQAALQLSRRAGELALDFQRKGVAAEDKPDDSPVTPADKAAEKLIAGGIEQAFPDDGLLGEEGAEKPARNGRKWIIDPIDGTRDFVRGNRFWATLIGFEAGGEVQVGVAAFPALGEVYYAVRGHGAWRVMDGGEPQRIHCSAINEMNRAVICYNGMNHVTRRPHAEKVLPLLSRCWAVRSIGGAIDAMLVCSGAAEIWVEPSAKPWDLAPIQIIAQESGALHFDYTGRDTIYGGNAVVCTPAFEAEARAFLGLP